jgi:hypothetical protein
MTFPRAELVVLLFLAATGGVLLAPGIAAPPPGAMVIPDGFGTSPAGMSTLSYYGHGSFPLLIAAASAPASVQPEGPPYVTAPMSTANSGDPNEPHCSAGCNSTSGDPTCSTDSSSSANCSADGGTSSSGYSCSAGGGNADGSNSFCSSKSLSASCSVQGGAHNTHCSAGAPIGDTGTATCSTKASGQICSAFASGSSEPSDGNSCSAYALGGTGVATCSAYRIGGMCSVTFIAGGNAQCTAYWGSNVACSSFASGALCSVIVEPGWVIGPGEDGLCHMGGNP